MGRGAGMRKDHEEAMRRALAADSNMMIINLRNAISLAEQCRACALNSEQPIAPVLGDVAVLIGDSAQLLRALGVALNGALEKLPAPREATL